MKLTIRHCEDMCDWYVIERAEHDGRTWIERTGPHSAALRCSSRFSDADVEGTGAEMIGIAEAIEQRSWESFKRCSVRVDGERVFFNSPRNSQHDGECTLAEADGLAAQIRARIGGDRGLRLREAGGGDCHTGAQHRGQPARVAQGSGDGPRWRSVRRWRTAR